MPENEEPDQVTHEPADAEGSTSVGRSRGLRDRLLGSLEGYLTRAATELDDRGEQLRRRSAELDRRAAEVDAAEANVAERERRLEALGISGRGEREQIDALLAEVDTHETARRAAAEEAARLRAELERRDAELAQQTATASEQIRRLVESEQRAEELTRRLGETEQTARDLSGRLAGSEERIAELTDRLATSERELAGTRARLDERERHIGELEAAHRRDLDRLVEELSGRERALAAAERDLVAVTARLDESDQRLSKHEEAHQRELDALLSRLAERDRTLADAQLALETARVKLAARDPGASIEAPREAAGAVEPSLSEREPKPPEPIHAANSAPGDVGAAVRDDEPRAREPNDEEPSLGAQPAGEQRASEPAASPNGEATEPDHGAGPAEDAHAVETRHLLFVPTPTRYTLVERDGPVPAPGEDVEANEARFRVSRVAPSPLPGDTRRCAYLQAID